MEKISVRKSVERLLLSRILKMCNCKAFLPHCSIWDLQLLWSNKKNFLVILFIVESIIKFEFFYLSAHTYEPFPTSLMKSDILSCVNKVKNGSKRIKRTLIVSKLNTSFKTHWKFCSWFLSHLYFIVKGK